MHNFCRCSLVAAAVLLPAAAHAQQPALTASPAAKASAPALQYDSAFSGYRRFTEESLADWRAVNAEVARAGGHIGIVGGTTRGGHGMGEPTAAPAEAGQPPARGAPQAPANGHATHH